MGDGRRVRKNPKLYLFRARDRISLPILQTSPVVPGAQYVLLLAQHSIEREASVVASAGQWRRICYLVCQ